MSAKLQTISLKVWRKFLKSQGCRPDRNNKHEVWIKDGLERPITFQAYTKEVKLIIIQNNLKWLGVTTDEFLIIVDNKCKIGVEEARAIIAKRKAKKSIETKNESTVIDAQTSKEDEGGNP